MSETIRGCNATVLSLSDTPSQNYTLYSYNLTATGSNATIIFAFTHTGGYWDLDDISFTELDTNQQCIVNGDFEMGSVSGWNYCNPFASNYSGYVEMNCSQNNNGYCYQSAAEPQPDYLSQTMPNMQVGHLYTLEFWLTMVSGFPSTNSSARVTLVFHWHNHSRSLLGTKAKYYHSWTDEVVAIRTIVRMRARSKSCYATIQRISLFPRKIISSVNLDSVK